MKGERNLFVLSLPGGGVAHVATWILGIGRRQVVEFCATLIPAEGEARLGSTHYPGWMPKTLPVPDVENGMGMAFGSSEIVADLDRNIVDLRMSAPGLGFRTQFIADSDPITGQVDTSGRGNQALPFRALMGAVTGLCGIGGLQDEVAGLGAWEQCAVDLSEGPKAPPGGGQAPPGGFSRAWVLLDDISLAFPLGGSSRGGPFAFGGPERRSLLKPGHETRVSGSLKDGLTVTISHAEAERSWTVLAEDVLDAPLVGYLPFSWKLERWWWTRRLPPWRLRLRALRLPDGPRVGLHEEWSLA